MIINILKINKWVLIVNNIDNFKEELKKYKRILMLTNKNNWDRNKNKGINKERDKYKNYKLHQIVLYFCLIGWILIKV